MSQVNQQYPTYEDQQIMKNSNKISIFAGTPIINQQQKNEIKEFLHQEQFNQQTNQHFLQNIKLTIDQIIIFQTITYPNQMATVPIYQLILESGSIFDSFPQLGRFAAYNKQLANDTKERKIQLENQRVVKEKEESVRIQMRRRRREEELISKGQNGGNMGFQYGEKQPMYMPISQSSSEQGETSRERSSLLTSREGNRMSKGSVIFGPDQKAPIFGINVKNTSINSNNNKFLITIFSLLSVTLLIGGIFGLYYLLTESKNQCQIDTNSYEDYQAHNSFKHFKLMYNLNRWKEGKQKVQDEDLMEEYVVYMQKGGYNSTEEKIKVQKKIQDLFNRTDNETQRLDVNVGRDLSRGRNREKI